MLLGSTVVFLEHDLEIDAILIYLLMHFLIHPLNSCFLHILNLLDVPAADRGLSVELRSFLLSFIIFMVGNGEFGTCNETRCTNYCRVPRWCC